MEEDTAGLSDLDVAKRAADAVWRLIKDVKIPCIPALGVDEKKLKQLAPQMTEDAITGGSPGNNPRQTTKNEIAKLYHLAYIQ
jgi:alcohol dehydrogenase class IV